MYQKTKVSTFHFTRLFKQLFSLLLHLSELFRFNICNNFLIHRITEW